MKFRLGHTLSFQSVPFNSGFVCDRHDVKANWTAFLQHQQAPKTRQY